jgi:hypothetical protein
MMTNSEVLIMASRRVFGTCLVLFAGAAMIVGVQVTQPLWHVYSPVAVVADDDNDEWVQQQEEQDAQDALNLQMMLQSQQAAEQQNEQAQEQFNQAQQQALMDEQQSSQ